ncbi:MAG: O-antigen ligase family protein [Lentisphaeria bacterium]|nr:O-antigen ligase family protein [Lentisphaeria bacterium]
MRRKLVWIPQIFLLALTFLLPLKFGSTVAVPEMPMTYWTGSVAILIASWPVMLFSLFAAFGLGLTILFTPPAEQPDRGLRLYGWLWALTAAATLPGWLHSTTWDFAAQNTVHLLGMLCWALAVIRMLESDPAFSRRLVWTMIAGLVFSAYSAFNQYLTGFDDTLKYIKDKEAKTGVRILEGQFATRLRETRVSGDFAVCNSYAGYLVLVCPLLLAQLWKLGGKVKPPLPARLILTVPVAGFFLFLLKETGSRGGALAVLAGGFLILPCLKLARKWKILLWSMVPAGLAAFTLLVKFGRGFNSMLIRFDYFQAAVRMMLLRPLTGAGWGEFLNDYLILKDVVNDEAPHSPHNFILTLGAQCGLPALLLSALLLALPLIAALLLLSRRCREESQEQPVLEGALVWGLGGWTFHSMMELNYETVGSLGLAVVLAAVALHAGPLPGSERLPERLFGSRPARLVFLLLCVTAMGAALLYVPPVVRAEMAFDRLHSMTDPRFASEGVQADPETVRRALSECDPRSPFPFAEVSSYYLARGAYHVGDALAMLDRAIERTPKRSAYHYRRYRICSMLPGREAEAEAALQKARELSPKNPQYYPDGVTPYGTRSY